MLYALIGIVFFLVVIMVAVRLSMKVQKPDETNANTILHASGIYSIVRRDSRESIVSSKPNQEEVRKYLADKNVDSKGSLLSESGKDELVTLWERQVEANVQAIENGDKEGVEFYYYTIPESDSICSQFIQKGHFVTRLEIYNHPRIVPPFHIGCTTILNAHYGDENLRDTTKLGMRPLFSGDQNPQLPHWNDIQNIR